nr:reverse transcriptase domain-containing protein [Tanacetum cinerariifolium]
MLFPFSLEGAAQIWLEKEPPGSIFTWDDLVLKFINHFFPPSETTNIHNEITNFQQRFDESFSEACDRFKDLLQACPHHDMVKALLLDKKGQNKSLAPVKAVEKSCVTCGGAHFYRNCPATDGNVYRDNIQEFFSQAFTVNYNQGNTSYHPLMMSNQIRPPGFPLVVENEPETTKDTMNPTNNGSTKDVQPQDVQSESPVLTSKPVTSPISEPMIALVSASKPNLKTSIPYPSRRNDERNREKANNQIEKFYQIFKDMSFEISF